MSNIRELALKKSAAEQTVLSLGMANYPFGDALGQARLDARYQSAKDVAFKAYKEYHDAIAGLSDDALLAELAPE